MLSSFCFQLKILSLYKPTNKLHAVPEPEIKL